MPPRSKASVDLETLLAEGLVSRGSDPKFILHRIPFGIPDLDELVNGGIPRKCVTILNGEYSCGKSFLIQLFMKSVQEQGLSVAYVDTERSYDPDWWRAVGLNINEVYVAQPVTGEDGVNTAMKLAQSGFDVVAIDSIAGLVPGEMTEEGAEKNFVAAQARLVTRLMQKALTTQHNAAIVCTNQLRSHLGPGPIDTMPGGWAQLFFSHVLLRIYRESWMEEKGKKIGFYMKVICRKSKVGTPYKECTLPFKFRGEIDILAMLAARAIDGGYIEQVGPWYSVFGGKRVQGLGAVITMLREDEELRKKLEAALGEVKGEEAVA